MDKYSIFEYIPRILRKIGMTTYNIPTLKFGREQLVKSARPAIDFLETINKNEGKSSIRDVPVVSTNEFDIQIIVPVYNTEKYISTCIESVLRQNTKANYIITIINDGSTDKSRDLIQRYLPNPHVELIDQSNKGFSGARNAGLNRMRGKYIMFLDSDDELTDGALDLFYTQINKGYDVIGGGFYVINEEGFVVGEERTKGNLQNSYPWGKIFKSSLFSNVQFPEGYWFEDSIMGFLIFPLAKNKINIDYPVYRYRVNPSGITNMSKGNPKIIDSIFITLQLLKDRNRIGMDLDKNCYESLLYQAKMNQLRLMTLHDRRIQKAGFDIMRSLINMYEGKTECNSLSHIEEAVRNGNFYRFLWICNM